MQEPPHDVIKALAKTAHGSDHKYKIDFNYEKFKVIFNSVEMVD